jgi:hypothetical protein
LARLTERDVASVLRLIIKQATATGKPDIVLAGVATEAGTHHEG